MTDEQIINIFKYCNESDCNDCYNCTARQKGKCTVPDLGIQVSQVIERQKAEIERLLQKLQQAKSEAIKEFARELKCGVPQETGVIRCKDIDDLVKQMTV